MSIAQKRVAVTTSQLRKYLLTSAHNTNPFIYRVTFCKDQISYPIFIGKETEEVINLA